MLSTLLALHTTFFFYFKKSLIRAIFEYLWDYKRDYFGVVFNRLYLCFSPLKTCIAYNFLFYLKKNLIRAISEFFLRVKNVF